jgi:hypothetical protein
MAEDHSTNLPKTLTQPDGEALKQALLEPLRRSEDVELYKLADEVANAKPWIDSSGDLYIGTWRLNRKTARLVKRTLGVSEGPIFEADVMKPTFKGSECPYRFFGLRALHTMRSRAPVHHRPADDGVGHQRAA